MRRIPDWLHSDFQKTVSQYQKKVLPHGLMIVGKSGDGCSAFASQLATKLLCSRVDETEACGQCKSCLMLKAGHHPDYLKIEPEGKSLTIKVDAIRNIVQKVTATAQQGGNKVVHIEAAEKMNLNAANALLKVLEEPTNNTFILLETGELSRLLPTLRSRCRIQNLTKPDYQQSVLFLQANGFQFDVATALAMANGSPLRAAQLTEADIANWRERESEFSSASGFVALSSYINKQDISDTLTQIMLWVDTAIRRHQGAGQQAEAISEAVLSIFDPVDTTSLFKFRDYILGKLSAINRQANLNPQLMAEELAAKWLSLRGIQ
ncbi:DNA polymerase III subunit delta' [Reinekea marinisedimentorum]|uniref:DNA-directed DNA polymerase n=1 Tax=Reinekea marinisedimentorum TaxID=230495 RepID=A0A4R3I8G3_9GAMM|nr:DNA polymerase III subunit delta' [Reinekea marinisedimentorum]TCS42552.1 DNA polymerase-3 subunit delta' [Reinekea marinisedimentorum]